MKLFLHPELEKHWRGKDPFTEAFNLTGEIVRQVKNRRTIKTVIGGRDCYVKLHTGVGWRQILKDLGMLKLPVLGADNEYQAVKLLHRLDISTTPLYGFGSKGRNPARRQSFIITRDVGNLLTLEDAALIWQSAPPSPMFRRMLVRETARISRLIHSHGINHRDYYICHFLIVGSDRQTGYIPDTPPKLCLIDLHRAQIRSATPYRWRLKDIAGIWFSAMDAGLSHKDTFRFIKEYTQKPLKQALREHRGFWKDVQRQAEKLYRKQHGKQPPAAADTAPGRTVDFEPLNHLHRLGSPPAIGIPRTLFYHLQPRLWENFFQELGFQIILSSPTGVGTLQRASLISEPEHCLPVKMLDAHVEELIGRADAVFVPRLLSLRQGHISCPKLAALPDSIKADFGDRTKIITIEIDARRNNLPKTLRQAARRIGLSSRDARKAADKAVAAMTTAQNRRLSQAPDHNQAELKFLLLGHPYTLNDDFFTQSVKSKLSSMHVRVEKVDFNRDPDNNGPIKWDMCAVIYDNLNNLHTETCDGAVQLTSFNCGCDSIVGNIFRDTLEAKGIPLLSLIMDEHTAKAGIDTRLEAFVDSILSRKHQSANPPA